MTVPIRRFSGPGFRSNPRVRRCSIALVHQPGGFTIVEMIGTCFLLGMLFSITIPMLLIVAKERRSTEQRQFALQHAANLLERATNRPWSELTPGDLSIPDADPDLQVVLPKLERTVSVKPIESEPDSRQIVASIRWQADSGQMVPPLRISAWVYPKAEK